MNGLTKKEKTRITIMHAAKGLFEKKGIANVTFNDIAEKSGVCRTTVFNHFSDTCQLMLALTSQEVDDVILYCKAKGCEGTERSYKVFEKLIEDASLYPTLTCQLINNAILFYKEDSPIKDIEQFILKGLKKDFPEDKAYRLYLLISGAYYGLLNHYHVNNKPFDAEAMKEEFRNLIAPILNQ